MTATTISIVVPVYAGADHLEALMDEIRKLKTDLDAQTAPVRLAEVIFVDDASKDGSDKVLQQLAKDTPWVVHLSLSRNFGQHAATVAGILHSSGDWVATLDEDLQHPPERVLDMLRRAIGTGADVVYANAKSGVHDAAIRDLTSRVFKRFMQWLTGNPKLKYFNSFRLMRGSIGRAVSSVCSHDTYFDVNLSWYTQRIEVEWMELKDERYIQTGKSNYSFRSLLGHAWRMLFSSHIKVLRLGAMIGFIVLGISVLGTVLLLTRELLYPDAVQVQGWTSLILSIMFFGGLSVLMLGIALQYLSTMILKSHGKPTFFVVDRSADADLATWFNQPSP
ncbi:MAG: glycosyltransferase family 2 protein [Pseudomonadota bacterium]